MNAIIELIRRGYEFLVASGNLLQSPMLLILFAYFFWQLFVTGQGHLANIGKVSEFFVTLVSVPDSKTPTSRDLAPEKALLLR
jgi:hypothetical protein